MDYIASNAFNSLNRQVALLNILNLCPSIATILINCYRSDIPLYIDGDTLVSAEGTTQGDPLAMAMYALSVLPLIWHLNQFTDHQVWYADDAAALGDLQSLKLWWDQLLCHGSSFGYFANPTKSWLLVKPELLDKAKSVFADTDVNVTSDGQRYLGSPIGSDSFVSDFVRGKVGEWVAQLERLNDIAHTQPHAAYSSLTHGFLHKFTYFFRTTPNLSQFVGPIEDCIRYHLIPTLTGQDGLNNLFRVILSLPTRLGGLGIRDSLSQSADHYSDSTYILSPLIDAIIHKGDAPISLICSEVAENKKTVLRNRQSALSDQVSSLWNTITDPSLLQCLEAASERGASSWLSALPIREHGFTLHKGDFRDALCLRYGWIPPYLSSHCVCGHGLSIEHALNCKCGGFPSICHNELRDITADLLTEVCHNVLVEPPLLPLNGESFHHRTAITEDNARVGIAMSDFWSSRQRSFLDVHVFNPFTSSYNKSPLNTCHRRNEMEKRRHYEERIRNVDHGTFTPLVFTTSGGTGPAASIFFKRLASMLAAKHQKPYAHVLGWIRCRLSFSLLRSSIICLRGARSAYHRPIHSFHTPLTSPLLRGVCQLNCFCSVSCLFFVFHVIFLAWFLVVSI